MTLIARIICITCACNGMTKWMAKNGSEHGNQLGHIQLIDESIFPLKFNVNGFVLVWLNGDEKCYFNFESVEKALL